MNDHEAIRIMAKLASYDKYHAAADRRKAEFLRHDYVYRQNMASRFFVFIGSLFAVIFYFMHRVVIDGLDMLNLREVEIDLLKAGIFIVLVQLLYSLLGLVLHSMDYNDAQERINEYARNMAELERHRAPGNAEYRKESRSKHYEPDDVEFD
jgi:hypothetical protein